MSNSPVIQMPQSARAQALAAARARLSSINPAIKTMSSVVIAELTGKEHAHVMRDTRVMLADLGLDQSSFGSMFLDSYKREQPCFLLPHDETICLMTGYDAKARMAVIKRWQELEAGAMPAPFVAPSYAESLRIVADQLDVIASQTLQIAAAAPAVAFVGKYVESTGSKGFRQVCKLIGANEPVFREFLTDQKIMYRLGGEWVPYAQHLDAGRFEVKAGTSDVSGHAFNAAMFTPKGIHWVAGEYAKYQMARTMEACTCDPALHPAQGRP